MIRKWTFNPDALVIWRYIYIFFDADFLMNGPVPPQDEVIMGGGVCWSFLLCGPALKDFGGVFFFFFSYPRQKNINSNLNRMSVGLVVVSLRGSDPLPFSPFSVHVKPLLLELLDRYSRCQVFQLTSECASQTMGAASASLLDLSSAERCFHNRGSHPLFPLAHSFSLWFGFVSLCHPFVSRMITVKPVSPFFLPVFSSGFPHLPPLAFSLTHFSPSVCSF